LRVDGPFEWWKRCSHNDLAPSIGDALMRQISRLAPHTLLFLLAGLLLTQAGCVAATPSPGPAEPDALLTSLQVTPQGDGVLLVLQVTNTLTTPIELRFTSGQSAEFVISDGTAEIWRWSDGRMFTQALRTETLDAGETFRTEGTWPVPAGAAGRFEATGILVAEGVDVEQRTTFALP
jgi:hypothetical protein